MNKTLTVMTVGLGMLTLGAMPSFAGNGQKGNGKHKNAEAVLKKIDTNNDGSISLEEFKASPRGQKDPAKAEETFKKLDVNSDGKISAEEWKAAMPAPKSSAN